MRCEQALAVSSPSGFLRSRSVVSFDLGGQLWWAKCLSGNPPNFAFLLCTCSSVFAIWKINSLSFSWRDRKADVISLNFALDYFLQSGPTRPQVASSWQHQVWSLRSVTALFNTANIGVISNCRWKERETRMLQTATLPNADGTVVELWGVKVSRQ